MQQIPGTAFPSHHHPGVQSEIPPVHRRILHVDIDAYFASVEELKNPHLQGRRVIVGGTPDGRGVVTSASYKCRQFGVRAGMPAGEAKRLCPGAIFVSGSLGHYSYLTGTIMEMFTHYSPFVQAISIDEAFLDITGCSDIFGSEQSLCEQMKNHVHDQSGLTCSLGVGPNKLTAKMASSIFKPDGLTILDKVDLRRVLYPLPVDKIWGVGPASAKTLLAAGINTVGDLAEASTAQLVKLVGRNGIMLRRIIRGSDDGPVKLTGEFRVEKSIGHEQTFAADSEDDDSLSATLHHLADKVGIRVRRGNWQARTVTVRIRYSDWETLTRRTTLPFTTDDSVEIYRAARHLFMRHWKREKRIRLLGISVSQLVHNSGGATQLSLFRQCITGGAVPSLDTIIDTVRERFGKQAIRRAYSHLALP